MRKTIRKILAFLIVASLLIPTLTFTTALAGSEEEKSNELIAAQALHSIGLFLGLGDDADGNPVFGLENGATRIQGLIMLLRFFGEFEEALVSECENPFADVTDAYNSPIVAYAFENGVTKGVSETRFDPTGKLTAAHYLTFILRALGYEDGTDFEWNAAWELTDELGITNGEFGATSNELLRGSLVIVSLMALEQPLKDSGETLLEKLIGLEAVPADAADEVSSAAAKIKENNKQDVETPDTPISPVPSDGDRTGGTRGENTTTATAWNIAKIPGAKVGDYVALYDIKEFRNTYIKVVTAGQITVNTPGAYVWWVLSAEYDVIVSKDGRTTNLDHGYSFSHGDYIELVDLVTVEWTNCLEVGVDGQVSVIDGIYCVGSLFYAEEVVLSMDGRTTNLDRDPGDLVRLRTLDTYDYSGLLEVGEDGEVAIEDGVYFEVHWISGEDIIVSTGGKTTNLGGKTGDFVRLYDLLTEEYMLPLNKVGEDGEVAIADGKYELLYIFPAEDILTPVAEKITIPDAIEGYVAELVELTSVEWLSCWYRVMDENGQVEDMHNGKYYLNGMIPLLESIGGKITGLGSFGLNEFDYVFLGGWGNDNYGFYRVGKGGEVQIPDGSYLLHETYTSLDYISSVNGVTVNLKSRNNGYGEGDYVWLNGMLDGQPWGYFRVGTNGEVAVADGFYNHEDGDYIPAVNILIIAPPK